MAWVGLEPSNWLGDEALSSSRTQSQLCIASPISSFFSVSGFILTIVFASLKISLEVQILSSVQKLCHSQSSFQKLCYFLLHWQIFVILCFMFYFSIYFLRHIEKKGIKKKSKSKILVKTRINWIFCNTNIYVKISTELTWGMSDSKFCLFTLELRLFSRYSQVQIMWSIAGFLHH